MRRLRPTGAPDSSAISDTLWIAVLSGALALGIYWSTAAPGFTWAHDGADGGDLLAAAAVNGVPHPPGYPLYTLALQGLLALGDRLWLPWEAARVGNLWSAWGAAAAVALTAALIYKLMPGFPISAANRRYLPTGARFATALLGGLAFGLTPILWSQAVITEVYALHAFFCAGLGLATFSRMGRLPTILILGGGLAHHPTFALLLPAALYAWLWPHMGRQSATCEARALRSVAWTLVASIGMASVFYLRIPWVAGWGRVWGETLPPPVLWGFPDNWQGFWWLVSGNVYHPFVLGVPLAQLPSRLWSATALLIEQYTVAGSLLAAAGLAHGRQKSHTHDAQTDGMQPHANPTVCALLWVAPPLLYAITYNTTDSYLYLMPVVWFIGVWAALGFHRLAERSVVALPLRLRPAPWFLLGLGLVAVLVWRWPDHNLRHDSTARVYIDGVTATVTPDSIILARTDAHTFALWYAAWGGGELGRVAPGSVILNLELYNQPWYRRLLATRYPKLVAIGEPLPDFLAANAAARDIWLTEPFPEFAESERGPQGVLWRYIPAGQPTQD